jgi:hypothetical protein
MMCKSVLNLEKDSHAFTNEHIPIVIGKNTFLKGKSKSLFLQGKENDFSKVKKLSCFLEDDLTKGKSWCGL